MQVYNWNENTANRQDVYAMDEPPPTVALDEPQVLEDFAQHVMGDQCLSRRRRVMGRSCCAIQMCVEMNTLG